MGDLNISIKELSKRVKQSIDNQNLTLEKCCDLYKRRYSREIESGNLSEINKDFVSRVKRGEFKTFSPRVAKFCELLEINLEIGTKTSLHDIPKIAEEISDFICLTSTDESMKKRFASLRFFLGEISDLGKKVHGGRV